jgi:6-phosphogluconolactonase
VTTVVYVANADSGSVSVLALDEASGALSTLQTLVLGGQIMPLALQPQGQFLWATRRSAPLAVVTLAIDAATGLLSEHGATPLPASMAHIATDLQGRWLLCASYHDGLVAVCALGAGGLAQPAHQILASGPKTHALRLTTEGDGALATVLGADQVVAYTFDAGRGQLVPDHTVALPAGSGPRHLALHPDGGLAWVLGELDGSVTQLRQQGARWQVQHTVSALPPGFDGTPWAADLRLSPDARFLVASERTSSTLALLAVDPLSGALDVRGHWPTQTQPRGFAISPSGRWLVCAGQQSHRVGVHRIDPVRGRLDAVSEHPVGQNPNWVEILALY